MKNYIVLIIGFFCFSNTIFSQEIVSKIINGKISTNNSNAENINIVNLHSKLNAVSDANGNFSIYVNVGDTLQFLSVQLKTIKYKINQDDFNKSILVFKMQPLVTELQEVKIEENKNINAVSLRILDKPAKSYTPAERKLYTAISGSGLLSVDRILNSISGRTTMLKKEIIVERKERSLTRIDAFFDDNYFIEKLKIPADYVDGFKYYAVEDNALSEAIKAKNKTLMKFILNELAIKWLNLQNQK